MSSYDLESNLLKKYGKSTAGQTGSAAKPQYDPQKKTYTPGSTDSYSLENSLLSKYSNEKTAERQTALSDWATRFNNAMQGVSDYDQKRNGGFTRDASGGFSSEINALIADFDNIKDYADRMGMPNSQRYLNQLKQLQNSIGQINDSFSQFEDEDAYNRYMDYWRDIEEKRNLDLDAYGKEIKLLENAIGEYKNLSRWVQDDRGNSRMVMSTMDKYQMDLQKGLSKQEAWKRNKKAIGVTVGIYSAGAILNAAFRAVMGAFRDDDEYETYGEKYWEAFKGNLVDELMPFNKIPIASDAYEIVKELVGVVTDYFWDYEIYGNAPETITGQLTDKGAKVVEILCQKLSGEDTGYTWYAFVYNLLQVASGISGLPMANFVREVVTFWNNTAGGLVPGLKVKTYEPTVKNAIKYAYLDGYLTYEEATEELLTNNQVDSQNEAHWIIKSWEGGKGYSKFGAVYQAMLEDGDVDAEMANYLPYGYTETEVLNNVKSMIGTAFREGEISKEAATDLLTRYFDMDTEDITAQINRWSAKVETGIAFDDIKDSFIYGDITEQQAIDMYMRYGGYTQKDARITVTEWKAQKETGVSMSDLEEQFVRGSVSEKDAISRLQKYSGVAKTDAEARIQEWKCEKETGISYDELSDRYVAGKITSTRAQELRVEYGGSSLEDARKTVLKWDCEKDHGIKYGELSTAYLSGDISKTDAINWQMEYGEKSRVDAELAVQAWVWRADNPKYKDLSDQKIDRFITHCVPSGIDITVYYKAQDHVKNIVSDGTSGNVKNQYVDYILSLGLSPYKAKAMWKALKNSTWKDTGTPFA